MRRTCLLLFLAVSLFLQVPKLRAQVANAQLGGRITDPSGAVIPNADVKVVSQAQGTSQELRTNRSGNFTFPALLPGLYKLFAGADGFESVVVDHITLNVGDNRQLVVQLKVGSSEQTVTVDGSGMTINTTDGSVSTVIDSKFVENTPLNGRSFQSLILLAPGTLTNSPQRSSTRGNSGEFSVNGQRTESNYYTVDGVSANSGSNGAVNGAGLSGALPNSTVLGTTQSLVSTDALQEFRIESSTYSAEYGRTPGGQFAMVTKSGTSTWHGSAFDYFRNAALDANNWFNDHTVPVTPRAAEHQNDFGGTVGGYLPLPTTIIGNNRTFFFFSYEGLRLLQPIAANLNAVPSLALRNATSGTLQQALKAFPMPSAGMADLASGLSPFVAGWSNPSNADATSVRFDRDITTRVHTFFRFADSPSDGQARGTSSSASAPSVITATSLAYRIYTLGLTSTTSNNSANDFRLNLTTNAAENVLSLDSFGGAQPVSLHDIQALPASGTAISLGLNYAGYQPELSEGQYGSSQRQWNVVDSETIRLGRHSIKLGIDWRKLSSTGSSVAHTISYLYTTAAAVQSNSVNYGNAISSVPYRPIYTNFSAFVQDAWQTTPRLALSLGIRWDVNPAPGVSSGLHPYTVQGLNDFWKLSLAPQGTPLWNTDWFDIAPRLGAAYQISNSDGRETVLRAGAGVFFDTGQQTGSYAAGGPGFTKNVTFGTAYGTNASFPLPPTAVTPPVQQPPAPPYSIAYANPSNLKLPYTIEWNVSVEQALGPSQSLTASYVGAAARKLLQEGEFSVNKYNPQFTYLLLFRNGLTSNYNALQIKYQRQVRRGLQVLASYTWSHALDYGSYNAAFPYQYANSDLDVRHNATGGVSYDLPSGWAGSRWSPVAKDWGIDGRVTARSGFPVTLNGSLLVDPSTNLNYYAGLNVDRTRPLYLFGSRSQYPGGRRINPAAFSTPASGQVGNAPRNFVNGFGATQIDVAVRRTFPIAERLHGQFRVEAFNIANRPNFGTINGTYGNAQFGQATATLSQSLGTLSPLYQTGGPRSLQLSLRLSF